MRQATRDTVRNCWRQLCRAALADRHQAREQDRLLTPIATWLENGAASVKPGSKRPNVALVAPLALLLAGQFGFDSSPTFEAGAEHMTLVN